MPARPQSVLQIGCGSFGPTHLEAWRRLGLRRSLWVADPDPEARDHAAAADVATERIVADYREVLGETDVVDIVAATDRHVEICLAACAAGKDMFVEKPLTLMADDARRLAEAVERTGRVLQVGYYFRHHPLTWYARERIAPRRTRRAALSLRRLFGLQACAQGRRLHRQRRRALPRSIQLAPGL
jgi:predicted dehydrogenase